MKKTLALFLSVLLMFSAFVLPASAEVQAQEYTKYPVILVPGYSSSELYRIDEETGETVHVWGDAFAQVGDALGGAVGELLTEAAKSIAEQNVQYIADRVGQGFNDIFGDMKCNPDGSSVYELYNYINTPAESNYKYLKETYPEGRHQPEPEMMAEFGAEIGDEHTYVYTCDFRMGAVENANGLRDFIDEVIAYENESRSEADKIDKVNLFAVSHGGQVSGTYLTLYGHEGKVNNAVLTIPALGGAGIAYDAFNAELDVDELGILMFVEHGFMLEEEANLLLQAEFLGFLDDFAEAVVPTIMDTVGYWGSLWDFIPVEFYEEIKAKWLDEEESAALIEQSDYMHYEIMSPEGEHYFAKGFKEAQQAGANVYILAGYDCKIATGLEQSSDAIITTNASTGAYCAPYGKRFADGYVQKVDTGFYQVSPSMTVDASTSYLPEHTWFIENYYHGMTYKDEFTFSLLEKLLMYDGVRYDVNSMPEYPQFHATTNPAHTVFAAFDKSKEGYISSEDTKLVIKNLSKSHNLTVLTASANGIDIDFTFNSFVLLPGESKAVSFKGEIPEVSLMNCEIIVSYLIDTVTPIGERVFDFTVMNGEAVEYDEENPFTDADFPQRIESVLDEEILGILDQYGVKGIVSTVYNIVYKLIDFIVNLVDFFKNFG